MRKYLLPCLLITSLSTFAQTEQDSVKKLNEVIIKPYFSTQPLLRATGTVGVADKAVLDRQPGSSFVAAANTIAGVRMEERSTGSYRLSIRGSLLRSPFGVRNVKIYFDDFPLTDAGGNSYLNALDVSGSSRLQVLKGPQSSVFGANSGGVILIQPQGELADSTRLALNLEGGAFGSFRENISLNQQFDRYAFSITQAYQRSDGYRNHSGMERKYFQLQQKLAYAGNVSLKSLIFYSDLHYSTPGGLNAAQYLANPEGSRPAAGTSKSAIEQQAGIYSKTFYAGVSNDWQISEHLKHVLAVYTSYTDFKNPFITNYEKRKEFTIGLRSYLEYAQETEQTDWRFEIGGESMQTATDFDNFDNNSGAPGAMQAAHDLKNYANFAFVNLSIDVRKKLLIELSSSASLYKYAYKNIFPKVIAKQTNSFDVQLMPCIALSYLIDPRFSVRASVSKGYSPPTIEEIRASNQVINTTLQPEQGWNYETGVRYQTLDNRLLLDLNGFYYHLKDAIVRRVDENDADFYINAGGTKQWGLETSASFWILSVKASGLIRGLQLKNAYTLSHFKFDDYTTAGVNFSGNDLTGVPKATVISSVDVQFPNGFYLFAQHNYTASIPLNDANTVYAKKYHLMQGKIGWKNLHIGKVPLELYVGADNILNQKYSLGNDLNAFGGRYFNAAATRNFYGGLAVKFNKR